MLADRSCLNPDCKYYAEDVLEPYRTAPVLPCPQCGQLTWTRLIGVPARAVIL